MVVRGLSRLWFVVFAIVVVVSLFGGVYAVWSRKVGHTKKMGVSGGLTEKSPEGGGAMRLSFFPRGYPEGVGLYTIRGQLLSVAVTSQDDVTYLRFEIDIGGIDGATSRLAVLQRAVIGDGVAKVPLSKPARMNMTNRDGKEITRRTVSRLEKVDVARSYYSGQLNKSVTFVVVFSESRDKLEGYMNGRIAEAKNCDSVCRNRIKQIADGVVKSHAMMSPILEGRSDGAHVEIIPEIASVYVDEG